jgi:hypothetical protein
LLPLTKKEEHRLRVFENRVEKRMYEPQMEELEEDWRRLHNEELHNLYASLNIIRVIKSREVRGARHVARVGDEKYIKILI